MGLAGITVFADDPGCTQLNLNPQNETENSVKLASEAFLPIIDVSVADEMMRPANPWTAQRCILCRRVANICSGFRIDRLRS